MAGGDGDEVVVGPFDGIGEGGGAYDGGGLGRGAIAMRGARGVRHGYGEQCCLVACQRAKASPSAS